MDIINSHKEVLFGDRARGLNIEVTLYLPRADYWIYIQALHEYAIQGEQILSSTYSNYQTFKLNIYQTFKDTSKLAEAGEEYDTWGVTLFLFDSIKLALYTLYYGKQQYNDVRFFIKRYYMATFGDIF